MHILEIPSFFTPLGGEFCLEQAKALKARGNEVRVISCNALDVSLSIRRYLTSRYGVWEERTEGIDFLRCNIRSVPKNIPLNQRRWCKQVLRLYDIYKAKYGRPDILHAHCCLWAGVAARMISEKEGIPYVITEHLSKGTFKYFGPHWTKHLPLRQLLRDTYEHSDCVIPVTEELVGNLEEFFGRNYRYTVVPNMIDTAHFAYQPRQPRQGRPYRYCCLAIAWIHIKGYDVLREAFSKLTDCELHIAGSGTDDKQFQKLFEGCDNVVIHGKLSKAGVRDLLYSSDALVLASRSEAQPLVILEAMSTGIPVVTTDIIPRCQRIEGACLIAPVGDAGILRQKMIDVRSIVPSQRIADAAREICSPDIIAEKIEAVFRAALE